MARIAMLANFYGPRSGGLRTSMNMLAREYVRAGHRVSIVVPGPVTRTTSNDGVTIHEVASPRLPLNRDYRVILHTESVFELLDEIDPDAIELSDRTTLMCATDWARYHRVPVSFIAHERVDGVIRSFSRGLPSRLISTFLNRRTASRVDRIVATTGFAAEEFQRIGIEPTRIPLGVDLDAFRPSLRSDLWRAQFQESVLLMLCSRLSREKAPGFAFDVLDACEDIGIDARLIVAGDGPMAEGLRERADGRAISMIGFVTDRPELARMLASVDVLLAPGPIETFGLAALEALASGTPVIANAGSALPEVLGPVGSARSLDAGTWATSVADIVGAGEVARRAARARAEQFPWSRTAAGMLRLHGLAAADDEPAPVT